MTLEELERSLPNGLHDAELLTMHVDYASGRAVLELNVDASLDQTEAEDYRRARVTFTGVRFVVIDPPDSKDAVGVSRIDSGNGQPTTAPRSLPEIPSDCFLCWLFAERWNGFIRIAAQDVTHQWIDSSEPVESQLRFKG